MLHVKQITSSIALLVVATTYVEAQCTIAETYAICVLEPTSVDELSDTSSPITGTFRFGLTADATPLTCVDYDISNIAEGSHGYHVHEYGSLHSTNALATGGHFLGECDPTPCRPDAAEPLNMEVGALNDGAPLVVDSTNTVTGSFQDDLVEFVGTNSIIGRSIVVHGLVSSDRIAQCVIGRADGALPTTDVSNVDGVTQADCVLTSTSATGASGNEVGYLRFTERDSSDRLNVEVWASGFQEGGDHSVVVRADGDITDETTTGAVFVGDNSAIMGGGRMNVGTLSPDNNVPAGLAVNQVVGDEPYAGSWEFSDEYASLTGDNSIIGRSVVISNGDGMPVAHCVVGILEEGAPVEAPESDNTGTTPKVLTAIAVLLPTQVEGEGESTGVHGTVEFAAEDGSARTHVRYFFTGLTPGSHGWHVHQWGDISSDDALATAGHFIGTCPDQDPPCRTNVVEIGSIGDNQMLMANADGEAYGEFIDEVLPLNGVDSIVGRSVVIHGNDASDTVRVAQGVIGRSLDSPDQMAQNQNPISSLRCDIAPTNNDDGYDAAGYVLFSRQAPDDDVTVDYNISGLTTGVHAWHVHHAGNLLSNNDGASTEGHFLGNPLPGRPGTLDEVGALGPNEAEPITADAEGIATGRFTDPFLDFHDMYSIVGRSMIIHAADSGAREAYCIIGIETEFDDAPPLATEPTSPEEEPSPTATNPENNGASSPGVYASILAIAVSSLAAFLA